MSGIENKKFQYYVDTRGDSTLARHVDLENFPEGTERTLEPGDTIDGYMIGDMLGRTSASEVSSAVNMETGEHVALKLPYTRESAGNIAHEVSVHRHIGRLPFVAMMDGFGTWQERPYIATRAQEQGTLYDMLRRHQASTIRGVVNELRDGLIGHAGEIDEPALFEAVSELQGDGLSQELARIVNSRSEVDVPELIDLVAEIAQESGHDIAFDSLIARGVTMRLLENELHQNSLKMPQGEELRKRLRIVGGTAVGVTFLHEAGYVHRDIKPANIGIDLRGTGKVIDLGISDHPNNAHAEDLIWGSLGENISPEGYRGFTVPESDVWALGATAFRALTGAVPIEPPAERRLMEYYRRVIKGPEHSVRELNTAVPSEVNDAVMAALHPDMHKRPSVEEFQEVFEKAA